MVGFESGTIKFMKNHFEIETIRHHTSPVKSIGVIRNNLNLDFITSCHDQINVWRLDEGITLLRYDFFISAPKVVKGSDSSPKQNLEP